MSKKFDRLLEKATAPTLLEPDWEGILNCVDAIRSADVPVKPAISSIKKRFHSENPHVALYALMVLEAAVKNCGEKVYKEIATKEFMEDLKHLAMESGEKVKEKVLELVQCWAHAFRNKSEYKIVLDTHNLMKLEGFEFPTLREADAMFSAESAPDWVDGENCYRCRASFGMLTRKHHCRACGQIFCDKCSSKSILLPHIGIEKEVRVCDSCYDKHKSKGSPSKIDKKQHSEESPVASSPKGTRGLGSDGGSTSLAVKEKDVKEREEEELAMAIALSQSEADEKEMQRQRQLMQLYNGPDSNEPTAADEPFLPPKREPTTSLGYKGIMDSTPAANGFETRTTERKTMMNQSTTQNNSSSLDSTDPELARYLNRAYWETKRSEQKHGILRQSPTPSAPPPSESTNSVENDMEFGRSASQKPPSSDFDHLMSVAVPPPAGGDLTVLQNGEMGIGPDDSVKFAAALRNQSLQDRLAGIQEARQAVEALREEHEKRKQEEILEAQRRRQIQMQQKLEVMRHKKHEMLEHQRMMALQRMQQQEQEMQIKKQMAAMGIVGGVQQQVVGGVQAPGMVPQQQLPAYGAPQQWLPQQQMIPSSQQVKLQQQQTPTNFEMNQPAAQIPAGYIHPQHQPLQQQIAFSAAPAPPPVQQQVQPVSVSMAYPAQFVPGPAPELMQSTHQQQVLPPGPIGAGSVQPTYVYQQPAPAPFIGHQPQGTNQIILDHLPIATQGGSRSPPGEGPLLPWTPPPSPQEPKRDSPQRAAGYEGLESATQI